MRGEDNNQELQVLALFKNWQRLLTNDRTAGSNVNVKNTTVAMEGKEVEGL